MKRAELTVAIMKDRGFRPVNSEDFRLKDIVYNIQENKEWRYLRCRLESDDVYTFTEYGMCSTYEIKTHRELLEVSADKEHWYAVAYRYLEFNRICKYAD